MGKRRFKYMYCMGPIDYWGGASVADPDIEYAVLEQMPDEPRDGIVYKLLLPNPDYDYQLRPIYLCKGENNGTVYIFSDWDIKCAFKELEVC